MFGLVDIGNMFFRYRGLMLPAAILLVLVPGAAIYEDPFPIGLVGFGLGVIGQILCVLNIGLSYIIRGGKNHQVYAERLVTDGLYAHVRNPMYVANFVILCGFCIASNSWIVVGIALPLVQFLHVATVRAEEKFLRDKFGAEFEQYCARVPRWLPRLSGIVQTLTSASFKYRRVLVKEYVKPFGWLCAIGLLIVYNIWRTDTIEAHPMVIPFVGAMIFASFITGLIGRKVLRNDPSTAT